MVLALRVPENPVVVREFGPYPTWMYLGKGEETAVQRHLRRGGAAGWEPHTQATLLALVQTSDEVTQLFDIGAHVGMHSLLTQTIFGPERVHVVAFEPTPSTLALLRELADRNDCEFTVVPAAVGAQPGTATLYLSDKAETSNSLAKGFRPSSKAIDVDVVSLDSYCIANDAAPSVVKIDVGTFEAQVLNGARQTVADVRPAIVCELLGTADDNATRAALTLLDSLSYWFHYWSRDDRSWVLCEPDELLGRRSKQWKSREFLFLPEGLSPALADAIAGWLACIDRCTSETNRKVSEDEFTELQAAHYRSE